MLPSQVGLIDPNRLGKKGIASRKPAVRANRSYLRRALSIWLASVLMCVAISAPQVSGQSKGRKKKGLASATPSGTPGDQSLTNIPLPVGHEAKGLVLPDFDTNGHLRGRFEEISGVGFVHCMRDRRAIARADFRYTGGFPFADENRKTGKGESEKQRQKER